MKKYCTSNSNFEVNLPASESVKHFLTMDDDRNKSIGDWFNSCKPTSLRDNQNLFIDQNKINEYELGDVNVNWSNSPAKLSSSATQSDQSDNEENNSNISQQKSTQASSVQESISCFKATATGMHIDYEFLKSIKFQAKIDKSTTNTFPKDHEIPSTSSARSNTTRNPNIFMPYFVGNTELNFLGSGMVEVAPDLYLQSDYYLMTNIPALGTIVSPVYTTENNGVFQNDYNVRANVCPNVQCDKKFFVNEAMNRIKELTSASATKSINTSTQSSNDNRNATTTESSIVSPSKDAKHIFPIEEISEPDIIQYKTVSRQKDKLKIPVDLTSTEAIKDTNIWVNNEQEMSKVNLPNEISDDSVTENVTIKEKLKMQNKMRNVDLKATLTLSEMQFVNVPVSNVDYSDGDVIRSSLRFNQNSDQIKKSNSCFSFNWFGRIFKTKKCQKNSIESDSSFVKSRTRFINVGEGGEGTFKSNLTKNTTAKN